MKGTQLGIHTHRFYSVETHKQVILFDCGLYIRFGAYTVYSLQIDNHLLRHGIILSTFVLLLIQFVICASN